LFEPLSYYQQWLFALVGLGIIFAVYNYTILRQWDFNVYYLASNVIWQNDNPYNPQNLINEGEKTIGVGYGGLPYLYSPLLARVLFPIAMLPFFEASFLWALLKCICLELTVFLILLLLQKLPSIFWLSVLHIIVLLYRPIALDMNAGNVAIFESTLILLFLVFWKQGQNTAAAIALIGAAALFKLVPLILLLYPLHLRDWRLLRSMAGVGLGFILYAIIDISSTIEWIHFFQSDTWLRLWDEQVQSFYNSSSTTVILRTFSNTYFAEPLIESGWAVNILVPLFPILIFTISCFSINKYLQKKNQPKSPLLFSLLICTLLLLPPRLAGYTLVWTLFPLTFLLLHAIQHISLIQLILLGISLFLIQSSIPPEHIANGFMQLLIDKEFFGLLLFYFCLIICVKKS